MRLKTGLVVLFYPLLAWASSREKNVSDTQSLSNQKSSNGSRKRSHDSSNGSNRGSNQRTSRTRSSIKSRVSTASSESSDSGGNLDARDKRASTDSSGNLDARDKRASTDSRGSGNLDARDKRASTDSRGNLDAGDKRASTGSSRSRKSQISIDSMDSIDSIDSRGSIVNRGSIDTNFFSDRRSVGSTTSSATTNSMDSETKERRSLLSKFMPSFKKKKVQDEPRALSHADFGHHRTYRSYRMSVDSAGIIDGYVGENISVEVLEEPRDVEGEWESGVCYATSWQIIVAAQDLAVRQEDGVMSTASWDKIGEVFWEGVNAHDVSKFHMMSALGYLTRHKNSQRDIKFQKFLLHYPAFDFPFYNSPDGVRKAPVNAYFAWMSIGVDINSLFQRLCSEGHSADPDYLIRVYFNKKKRYVELQYGLVASSDEERPPVVDVIVDLVQHCELPYRGRKQAWKCLAHLLQEGLIGLAFESDDHKEVDDFLLAMNYTSKKQLEIKRILKYANWGQRIYGFLGSSFAVIGTNEKLIILLTQIRDLLNYITNTIDFFSGKRAKDPERFKISVSLPKDQVKFFQKAYEEDAEYTGFEEGFAFFERWVKKKDAVATLPEEKQIEQLQTLMLRILSELSVLEKGVDTLWDSKRINQDIVDTIRLEVRAVELVQRAAAQDGGQHSKLVVRKKRSHWKL